MNTKVLLKKLVILLLFVYPFAITSGQNMSINGTGNPPDAGAMLDIVSANKGLLIPRVSLTGGTSAATPLTPPITTSMMVYNTYTGSDVTPGYYYWDGAKWVRFWAGKAGWELTGNDISSSPTSFLGTTSANDLIFKTSNTEKMRIKTSGEVGIGTNNPTQKLDVLGNVRSGISATSTPYTLMGTHATYGNTYSAWWKEGLDYSLMTNASNSYLNAPIASGNIFFSAANDVKMTMLGTGGYFGIGITPTEKLHVNGNVRFAQALMPNNNPGTSGDMLVSQGANLPPLWKAPGEVMKAFGANSTRTLISLATFTQITGLSVSVTVTQPSLLLIFTYGAIETTATNEDGGTGTIIQVFQDGTGIPTAEQTIDVANTTGYYQLVTPWAMSTFLNVGAGATVASPITYLYTVKARKYIGSNFYAGGSTTSPQPNEGGLTILVVPQ